MGAKQKAALQRFAATIRVETIKEFKKRGFGHVGGAMSVVDLLAVLYGGVMRIDPKDPGWEGRDRLVMSKGHAGPALYATLALKGYFPLDWLGTLNIPGTRLPSHCDRNLTPGIDMTTGSLGQGYSMAVGMALGFKSDGRRNHVYAVIGDGECDEGQVWEATLFAAHNKLDNLTLFVDANKKQLDGYTDDIIRLGDIAAKFREFGWHALAAPGHDVEALAAAVDEALGAKGAPTCVVMDTVKGAGFKEAEQMFANHHITVSPEQADRALADQQAILDALDALDALDERGAFGI